jgi:SAM-dependent MidA family methyltransferase
MNALAELIRQDIAREGCISFARFMELALYCPTLGYYERTPDSVGRSGDFYTNVSVGRVFGELLARQFAQGRDDEEPFQLVEAGAHQGQLAGDILEWMRRGRPDLWERLEYWIIEPSLRRRAWQEATLEQFAGRVRWFAGWEALPQRVRGVIFSNELLDAFPVERFTWDAKARAWFTQGVGWDGTRFVWRRFAGALRNLREELARQSIFPTPELEAVLPEGFTLDLSPAAVSWWAGAAQQLQTGQLVTIDYGLAAGELLRPERAHGTLRAYFRHQVSGDVLSRVGEQDLTAQVNFTALERTAVEAGLVTVGLFSQGEFLTRLAVTGPEGARARDEWGAAAVRQFQTLIHPEHLGRSFRVLVQTAGPQSTSASEGNS